VALLVNDGVPSPDLSPDARGGRDFSFTLEFAPGAGRQFLLRMVDPFGEVQEARYEVVAAAARRLRQTPAFLEPPSALAWNVGTSAEWVSFEQGTRWDWTQMTTSLRAGLHWDVSRWLEGISLHARGEASVFSWVKSPAGTEAGRQVIDAAVAWKFPWVRLPRGLTVSGGARWSNLSVPSRSYGFRNVLGPEGSVRGDWYSSRRNRFSAEAGMALVGSSLGLLPLSNLSWFAELSWRHALRPALGYRDWDWRIRYQRTSYAFGTSPIRMDEAAFGLGFFF